MTDLRDKIAATIYCHILFRALDQCECGAAFDGFCGHALDAYAAHVADAVIEALSLRTDQVGTLTRYVTEWTPDD